MPRQCSPNDLAKQTLTPPVQQHVCCLQEAMNSWVALVGKQGCKLYPARVLFCYKGWPIDKVLQLNKSSCEVALTMSTNRQARAGLNVAPDIANAAKASSGLTPLAARMDMNRSERCVVPYSFKPLT